MILGFEAMFASVAVILCLLCFRTLRTIKHLGVGKSFWIPMLVSGVLFFTASIITILDELQIALAPQTFIVIEISRILGLSILSSAIFIYSRRVTANLKEEFTVPQHILEKRSAEVLLVEEEVDVPDQKPTGENINQPQMPDATSVECQHQLGYLRTLPRNALIPAECLSCDQIIECKHPLIESQDSGTISQ